MPGRRHGRLPEQTGRSGRNVGEARTVERRPSQGRAREFRSIFRELSGPYSQLERTERLILSVPLGPRFVATTARSPVTWIFLAGKRLGPAPGDSGSGVPETAPALDSIPVRAERIFGHNQSPKINPMASSGSDFRAKWPCSADAGVQHSFRAHCQLRENRHHEFASSQFPPRARRLVARTRRLRGPPARLQRRRLPHGLALFARYAGLRHAGAPTARLQPAARSRGARHHHAARRARARHGLTSSIP
jgi:hypothetical protein